MKRRLVTLIITLTLFSAGAAMPVLADETADKSTTTTTGTTANSTEQDNTDDETKVTKKGIDANTQITYLDVVEGNQDIAYKARNLDDLIKYYQTAVDNSDATISDINKQLNNPKEAFYSKEEQLRSNENYSKLITNIRQNSRDLLNNEIEISEGLYYLQGLNNRYANLTVNKQRLAVRQQIANQAIKVQEIVNKRKYLYQTYNQDMNRLKKLGSNSDESKFYSLQASLILPKVITDYQILKVDELNDYKKKYPDTGSWVNVTAEVKPVADSKITVPNLPNVDEGSDKSTSSTNSSLNEDKTNSTKDNKDVSNNTDTKLNGKVTDTPKNTSSTVDNGGNGVVKAVTTDTGVLPKTGSGVAGLVTVLGSACGAVGVYLRKVLKK